MENKIEYFGESTPNIEEGKKFFDTSFEHDNDETIFGKKENWDIEKVKYYRKLFGYKEGEKIKWTRIFENEIIPYNEEKEGKLDLKQGNLGDCCSISYIHCLKREFKDKILSSVISDCRPIEGYFEVLFYFLENEKLVQKKVFVDDFIPYKTIPKSYKTFFNIPDEQMFMPIFSKLDNYMVGKYLLIEKAYAKINGSYMALEGKDIAFNLTGVNTQDIDLVDILKEKFVLKSNALMIQQFESEFKKVVKETKAYLKEFKGIMKLLSDYLIKKLLIDGDYLDKSDKEKIFEEIKKEKENKLFRAGSEHEKIIEPRTSYGVWGSHMYDFINCEKINENLFFYLWNPHGKNPNTENNYYNKSFQKVNEKNKNGLKNGDIVLNFDGFFLSFRSIIYQNKEEILKVYEQFKTKDIFEKFGLTSNLFFHLFGYNFDFFLSLLWLNIFQNKGKDNKTIFFNLMEEIGSNVPNSEMNKSQILIFIYLWKSIKENIIKESENIMKEKINKNINENDLDKIIKILKEENENNNEYFKIMSSKNIKYLNEKLDEIRKELEPIARKIAEKYIQERKEEEEERRRRIRMEEERRREEEKRKRESYKYEIRTILCNKNLDGVDLKRSDQLHLWDVHHGNNQKFRKIENDDGSVTFVNGDKAIDVRGAEVWNGNAIQIYDRNYTKAQKFYIKDRGNGTVSIHSALNQNYCLDVCNFGTSNGTKIILWKYKEKENNNNQKFKLIK